MPIIASGDKTFTPCPQGVYQAVCCDIVDLGNVEVTFGGNTKTQHKIAVVWMVNEPMEDGRPYIIQQRYTLSLGEKSNLRRDLQSWRGKPFTADELKGFDVEKLIGANCQINVIHRASADGRVWANVSAIMPLSRGMTKMAVPADYLRKKDRPENAVNAGNGNGHADEDVDTFIAEDDAPPF